MQAGDIVVAFNTPARFKNIKNGSLWKVLKTRGYVGGNFAITVGDAQFPDGIKTFARYFYVLDRAHRDAILNTGNTDLAVRLRATLDFAGHLKPAKEASNGSVRVKVNGVAGYFGQNIAKALAAKNPGKLLQSKLAQATGR